MVIVRFSLSTANPPGFSCARAGKVVKKKTTATTEDRFIRSSNPIVRARNGHTNPKRKRGDSLPRLRFGLMCCTFAHGPVASLTYSPLTTHLLTTHLSPMQTTQVGFRAQGPSRLQVATNSRPPCTEGPP